MYFPMAVCEVLSSDNTIPSYTAWIWPLQLAFHILFNIKPFLVLPRWFSPFRPPPPLVGSFGCPLQGSALPEVHWWSSVLQFRGIALETFFLLAVSSSCELSELLSVFERKGFCVREHCGWTLLLEILP